MADTIHLQHGAAPWEGDSSSDLVRMYDYYDRPLMGVIDQAGTQYLFQCIAGHVERFSLWKYTLLEPDAAAAVEAADDPDEFEAVIDRVSDRAGVLAVAVEGHGIVAAREFYDTDDMPSYFNELFDDVEAFAVALREGAEVQRQRLSVGAPDFFTR